MRHREPPQLEVGRIDQTITIHYKGVAVPRLTVTFFGPEYDDYEVVTYSPNGKLQAIEHGKTDDMLVFLRAEKQRREVTLATERVRAPET